MAGQDLSTDVRYGHKPGYAMAHDGKPYFGYEPERHIPICAGGTKRTNKYGDRVCLRSPLDGRKRCKRHNGSAGFGADNHNYRHGKTASRYRNVGALGALIEQQLSDPDFLSSAAEIGAFRSRFEKVLTELEKVASADITLAARLAKRAYDTITGALASGNAASMQQGIRLLEQALQKEAAVNERWESLQGLATTMDRLVGREMTLEKINQGYISNTDFVLLLQHIQSVIMDLGLTPEQKARFQRGMSQTLLHQRLMAGTPVGTED